tara:strand:- start:52 stop:249 length:198 start_codon:yes stop_codon:yes gene_type:complete
MVTKLSRYASYSLDEQCSIYNPHIAACSNNWMPPQRHMERCRNVDTEKRSDLSIDLYKIRRKDEY